MFRTKLKPLFVLLAFLSIFSSKDSLATHLVGGSLNYEYIGENADGTHRYRIFSVTFTDCGADSNFPDPEEEIPVAIYENDLGDPDADKVLVTQFIMPRISFEEIELAGLPSGCDVGSDICVERAEYEFFVNLPLNFDGYWLYYDRCCRNNAVVNLTPLQGVGFSTFMPSSLLENNSPFFNAPPTPFLCAGDTTTFLNTAIDPDGDLMVFSFINPFRGYSSDVDANPGVFGYPDPIQWEVPEATYNPGFSVTSPFGTDGYAFINGATGLTTYMVPNEGQYSVALEIKEYRNGNLIGITRRDLQLTVINCPPNPSPDLSNESAGNVGPTEWEIDEGDTLCFPVIFADENGDSLTLQSFGEIFDNGLVSPSAAINTPQSGEATVQADFCWFTDCDQGRDVPYFFGVTAIDNGCPPKSASEVYTVQVIPFSGSTDIEGTTTPCENSLETYTTDLFVDGSYTWTVTGGTIVNGAGTNEIDVQWAATGTGTITVTATNFRGCVGDPLDLDVAIFPLPVIDAGADLEICLGDTISIGGAPTGPGGSFFIWGPNENISSTDDANPEVFPIEDVEYNVQVVSANACSARDTISITVNEAILSVSDDVEICEGQTAQLQASGAIEYIWTPDMDLSNDSIASPIASPTATTTYMVESIDANLCRAESSVTVTVFEVPVAEAGIDSTLCGLGVQLYAIQDNGIGEWTIPAEATINNSNSADAIVTVADEGGFDFIWEESTGNGLCLDRDTVNISFIAQPLADAGLDDDVCGLNYTLGATPSVGAGIWTIPADLMIDDNTNPNSMISAAAHGEYTLTWEEENGICTDQTTVTIDFLEIPASDPGLPDVICGDTYTLNATPSIGGGTWSGSGNVSFSDATDPAATVTSAGFGIETLTWTEDNEGCTDQNIVDITFNEIPVADAGTNAQICGLQYTMQANPSVGTGTWTAPLGITVSDLNSAQSLITSDGYGTFTLTWSELNVDCSDENTVEITFVEEPITSVGMDDQICGDSYVLSALPSVGTGLWSGSGNVTFSDISDPTATVTSTLFGTETITWTEDNNGCIGQAGIDVTFFEIPVADAGSDISICGTMTALDAQASIGTGTWTGPSEIGFADPNAPSSESNGSDYGSYILTWTEDSNGCIDSDEMTVELLEIPIAVAGSDLELCINSSIQLEASGGDSYSWTPDSDLDNSEVNDPSASPSDTTTYTVTVSLNNGCSSSDELTINVNDLPIVDAGQDVTYLCLGDSIQLNATSGYDAYLWTPNIGLSDDEIASPFAAPNTALAINYAVTVTDEIGCQNSDTVLIQVNNLVPTDAGSDTLICQGEPIVLGASPVSPNGTTYAWSPNEAMSDSTAQNPVVNPTETTTYLIETDNSICEGSDVVTVFVEETPNLEISTDAIPSCDGLAVRFNNDSDPTLNYAWDLGNGTISEENAPSAVYNYSQLYMVTLTGTSDLDCTYEISEFIDAQDFTTYFDLKTPNVISPNGDGFNDALDINVTGQIQECLQMEVFNRWGQVMFISSGNNTKWDGRTQAGELVQPGVYFYYIEFNGASYKGNVEVLY